MPIRQSEAQNYTCPLLAGPCAGPSCMWWDQYTHTKINCPVGECATLRTELGGCAIAHISFIAHAMHAEP